MTRVSKLGILFLVTVASAVLLLVSSWWFDENARLDAELAALQSKASKAMIQAIKPAGSSDRLQERLRSRDRIPVLVDFASQVKAEAGTAGLVLEELSLKELPGKEGMVTLQTKGTMAQWFAFEQGLEEAAGPLVFRGAQFELIKAASYQIRVVVGYAVEP